MLDTAKDYKEIDNEINKMYQETIEKNPEMANIDLSYLNDEMDSKKIDS